MPLLEFQLKIEHSDIPIKSIDVQLVRVETCGCAEGFSKDGSFSFSYTNKS